MIQKILIAEDYESSNLSVQKTLADLNITNPDYVYYCDDALLRIQKAVQANASYDLLITDLHFEEDHRQQKITSGTALIAAARRIQPDLKILVFSATGKPAIIEALFEKEDIDGYVYKGRNDARELKLAIEQIAANRRYVPQQFIQERRQKNAFELDTFDITLLSLMVKGMRQQEISEYLKKNNQKPSALSSIEKRLNALKEALDCNTNEQLVAHCVKMGIV
ncbi:response regulator [Niabella sp. CC-SYL272]|uniref:response regulator n=1 Tax=Niabella agricola TaxID=2891571 RepID=UPI001F42A65C|nr:response regulator [Niabella agricola]MCF3110246.1 response regulator [Niabella agricola]